MLPIKLTIDFSHLKSDFEQDWILFDFLKFETIFWTLGHPWHHRRRREIIILLPSCVREKGNQSQEGGKEDTILLQYCIGSATLQVCPGVLFPFFSSSFHMQRHFD